MGEVNGVTKDVVICVKGLGRGEGRVLQALMIIINIFIFTPNKIGSIWTLWFELLQSVLCEKNHYFFCQWRDMNAYHTLGLCSQLSECSQTRLWWELWLPWLPPDQHSLWQKFLHQGWDVGHEAPIFLSIRTPVSFQGFPLNTYGYKPEDRGARTMKLLDIGFAGLGMEQRGWVWIWKNN